MARVRTTTRNCYFAAWFAIASRTKAKGNVFHMPIQYKKEAEKYGGRLLQSAVFTWDDAVKNQAFSVEFPSGGGVRLRRYLPSTGESDIGPYFDSLRAFHDAMMLVVRLAEIT